MKLPLLLGFVLASILPRPWDREKFGGPDGALKHSMFDLRDFLLSEKELLDGRVDNRLFLFAGDPPAIVATYEATPAGVGTLNLDLAARLATNDCQLRLFQSARISQDSLPLSPSRPATNSAFAGVDGLRSGDAIVCCPPDARPVRTNDAGSGISHGLLRYQLRDLRLAVVGAADLDSYIASNRVAILYPGFYGATNYIQCNRHAVEWLKNNTVLAQTNTGNQWRLVKANKIVNYIWKRHDDNALRNAFLAEFDSVEPGDLVIHCR